MEKTTTAVNQPTTNPQLPDFKDVIKIEVEVQTIYNKLKATFPEDYKHREILSHAIIGAANNHGGLDYIYNALNGYTNDIDFKEGNMVICTEQERYERYDANLEKENGEPLQTAKNPADEDYKPYWKYRAVEIGLCRVNKIDLYATRKLIVEYESYNRHNGKYEMCHASVNHKSCTKQGEDQVMVVPNS